MSITTFMALAGGIQTLSSIFGGYSTRKLERENAALFEGHAQAIQRVRKLQARRDRREFKKFMAHNRLVRGGSGHIAEFEEQDIEDIMTFEFDQSLKDYSAAIDEFQARSQSKMAKRRGDLSFIQGITGGIAAGISTGANINTFNSLSDLRRSSLVTNVDSPSTNSIRDASRLSTSRPSPRSLL